MRIDIEPGDRFESTDSLWQVRRGSQRIILWRSVGSWIEPLNGTVWNVRRDDAIAVIRAMGHEVVEVAPEPAPVRITHAVELTHTPGACVYVGTKEACETVVMKNSALPYRVVPIVFGDAP